MLPQERWIFDRERPELGSLFTGDAPRTLGARVISGAKIELLPQCTARVSGSPSNRLDHLSYRFHPATRAESLYAFEPTLAIPHPARWLQIDFLVIQRWDAKLHEPASWSGDCNRATHWVSSLWLGLAKLSGTESLPQQPDWRAAHLQDNAANSRTFVATTCNLTEDRLPNGSACAIPLALALSPLHQNTPLSIALDAGLVTTAQFHDCEKASACNRNAHEVTSSDETLSQYLSDEIAACAKANSSSAAPMVCVSWLQASAYCNWRGQRLPSYSELLEQAQREVKKASERVAGTETPPLREWTASLPPEDEKGQSRLTFSRNLNAPHAVPYLNSSTQLGFRCTAAR